MSLRRTKSQGHLERYITKDLNKYMDETTANRIEKILGKQYAGSVRLYQFPIEKCKELKAYKVLEENTKQSLENVEVERQRAKKKARDLAATGAAVEVEPERIIHVTENNYNKLFFYKRWIPYDRKYDEVKPKSMKSVPNVQFVPFEPEIDFNALAIVSHKIAEKFARDSSDDFEVGPLKNTELVEFHTYATTHSKRQLGLLEKHTDDKTGVSYNTITMIWYLIKDKDVEGGNIIFYAPQPSETPQQRAKFWKYYNEHGSSPPDREVKINLWEQMGDVRENCVCLLFKGDIRHSPEPMGGTGERSAIVFQFERIDEPDSSSGGKIKRKNRNRNTRKIKKTR